MTPQEKKEYIFNNIDKYVIDSRGNFFHIDPNMLNNERYYIGKDIFTPEELKEIIEELILKIVEQKEDWEIIYYEEGEIDEPYNKMKGIRNKKNGYSLMSTTIAINLSGLIDWKNYYFLIGELGYRGGLWKDYVEKRERYIPKGRKNQNLTKSEQERIDELIKQLRERQKAQEEQVKKNFPTQTESENKENSNTHSSNQNQPTESITNHPTDNSNQKSNSPTQQQPITNNQDDTNDKDNVIEVQIQDNKTQITQTLKKHNLKTTDLPKKYHNWEEQLSKLTIKEEINSLVSEINQQIENKVKGLKREQNQKSSKQQSLSFGDKTRIGIALSSVALVILGIIIISWAVIKKSRRRTKR